MPDYLTKFNNTWLSETDGNGHLISQWCSMVENDSYKAHCFICVKTFYIKNAGIKQIHQHSNTKKHKNKAALALSKKQFKFNISVSADGEKSATMISATGSKKWSMNEEDKVTYSMILWTLKVIKSGYSFNSCDDISDIFKLAFSDSKIVQSFSMSPAKVGYEISHGLGPYFHDELISSVIRSDNFFSLSFDEATTDNGKKQLDIHIRFWNEDRNQIVCHFLRAFELGHATAYILKDKIFLTLALDKLPVNKLLALSSDGPPVNQKCLEEIDKELNDRECLPLIRVGSCNLHIVHNSFKYAMTHAANHWNIEDFLDTVFKFLHKYPARKEDFRGVQIEVGTKEEMIMRFVSNRWLTLIPVITRIINQWEALKEYFLKFIPESKIKSQLQSHSYRFLRSVLTDSSTLTRLHFLKSVGESFESFLKIMQVEEPLIHILYDELCKLIKSLLTRIVKPEKMQEKSISRLLSLDLKNSDNILQGEKISVGFLANEEAQKLKETDRKYFYLEAKNFIIAVIDYLLKHLPLKNVLLKNIHFLHPYVKHEQRSLRYLTKVAEQMPAVIKKEDIDKVCEEWKIYMSEETDDDLVNIENPSGCTKRIDDYWSDILQKKNNFGSIKYPYLSKLVKAVLSIYHGQADVERGFSVNRRYVSTSRASLNEKTINSLRTVEAEIRSRGGDITKIPASPKMLKSFREAHKMYKEYLEENKKEEEERKALNLKRKCDDELKSLQAKKKLLQKSVDSSHSLIGEANTRLSKAVENNNMAEVCSAQALLQSGHKMLTEKGEELKKVELQLNMLMKKVKR